MFQRTLLLEDTEKKLNRVSTYLFEYLSTKNSDSLGLYMQHASFLEESVQELQDQVSRYTEEELMILDIIHMTSNFLTTTELAVDAKRRSHNIAYTEYYNEAILVESYITQYIKELNARQLSRNAMQYTTMLARIQRINVYNIVLMVSLMLLSLLIVYKTAKRIVTPISILSDVANRMASGAYDIEDVHLEQNDELTILAKAFNKMKWSIQSHFDNLKEKAETEAKLKDQELKNLQMQSLVDQAHMYALQAQMNPHFLFNTINAAVQLAKMEHAEKTRMFLESMSRLFRYNVKERDSKVTLQDEVENIRDYLDLLTVRFGDMISYSFDIDAKALSLAMPPLILQPIVENAYVHGFSEKEDPGRIHIEVLQTGGGAEVRITDNGKGIDADTQRHLLQKIGPHATENSTGVGLQNIIKRLELYYHQTEVVDIQSELGKFTTVVLRLAAVHTPKQGGTT